MAVLTCSLYVLTFQARLVVCANLSFSSVSMAGTPLDEPQPPDLALAPLAEGVTSIAITASDNLVELPDGAY